MSMAKPGRPVTKKGPKASKHRKQASEWYQKQSPQEKDAIVQRRSKSAQRKADAKRLAKDPEGRSKYHAEQAQAKKDAPPKPKTCQWPGCSKSTGLELHHQSKPYKWYCEDHHAQARKAGK